MGSMIEFNDTLKFKVSEPSNLVEGEKGEIEMEGLRYYHLDPVRVFLVEEIAGKWNYLGHAVVSELHLNSNRGTTLVKFVVKQLYPIEVVPMINKLEAPEGKAYRP